MKETACNFTILHIYQTTSELFASYTYYVSEESKTKWIGHRGQLELRCDWISKHIRTDKVVDNIKPRGKKMTMKITVIAKKLLCVR